MKNKTYTVFFASDRNTYSRSFQISKLSLNVLLLFGIIILGFALIGGLRIANKDKLSKDLKNLQEYKFLADKILTDLNYSGILDSANKYEGFLLEHFSDQPGAFPDLAPVSGYVTRGVQMEENENHPGIDIAAKFHEEILAPADGMVVYSGKSGDLGNAIILSHTSGFFTVFGHNDTNLVKPREIVTKGQVIAKVGETGKSKGPHLHFEIWKINQVMDPRKIIKEYKKNDVSIR